LPEYDSESNDDLLKVLHTESLLNEINPSSVALFDQADGHPRGLQKRGRRSLKICFRNKIHFSIVECLWKVCSWALDKRSARSLNPSADTLAKLLY